MVKKCPVCSSRNLSVVFQSPKGSIVKCKECHFAVLTKPPTAKELTKLYTKNYFDDKFAPEYWSDAKHKFNYIKRFLKGEQNILDFGCGLGYFLALCKKNSHQAVGYDISKYAADYVAKTFDIQVKCASLKSSLFPRNTFDSITMFDVIEHIPNFQKAISIINYWLKHHGYLFITTPNIESWDAKLLGKHWYGYTKIAQHINYFSPSSMARVLEKNNFTVVQIKNWGFVRSLSFILTNLLQSKTKLSTVLNSITSSYLANRIHLFFPMTDMITVARKKP